MPSIWDLPRREEPRGSAMPEPRARMLQVLGLLGTPFPTSSELRTGAMYRGGKMDAMAGGPTRSEFQDEQIRKVSDLGLNLFGIFKGVKGATKAEKQALFKAQEMARAGADRDSIWNATLWYKGKDGKWRTEIDDSAAGVQPDAVLHRAIDKQAVAEGAPTSFPQWVYMDHPQAYSAYPDAKNIAVRPTADMSGGASYGEASNMIGLSAFSQNPKSSNLHELQHAIQQREGMARGGGPEAMAPFVRRVDEVFDVSDAAGYADALKQSGGDKEKALVLFEQWYNRPPRDNGVFLGEKYSLPDLESMLSLVQNKPNISFDEAYRRLLGEVDARNTQTRMDMTLDQRREFPPWSTWDVPEADQIVRMEGGPAMMVAPKKLEQGLAGESGYVYHATNADRLNEILTTGKLNTHKPWDFTEQDFWPDGSTAKRAYFGKGPENLWQFAPPEGQPVVVRAKESAAKFKRESTGDIFTEKPIGAKNLEFLGDDGIWHPLTDLNK